MTYRHTFLVDGRTYSKTAIFSAIDALSAEYCFSALEIDHSFKISISSRYGKQVSLPDIKNIFFDELNNQVIRRIIMRKTQKIRELIVGKALLTSEAFNDEHDYFKIDHYPPIDNYILDLNKISVSWSCDEK
jgi:His-Xaa-Ser system protein HxsD